MVSVSSLVTSLLVVPFNHRRPNLLVRCHGKNDANAEAQQMMGSAPADPIAATLFASQSVAGASVFRLVRDLDELSAALEQAVKEMGEAAEHARRVRMSSISTTSSSQVTPESRERNAAATNEDNDKESQESKVV